VGQLLDLPVPLDKTVWMNYMCLLDNVWIAKYLSKNPIWITHHFLGSVSITECILDSVWIIHCM
jgi:hypothetical protein